MVTIGGRAKLNVQPIKMKKTQWIFSPRRIIYVEMKMMMSK